MRSILIAAALVGVLAGGHAVAQTAAATPAVEPASAAAPAPAVEAKADPAAASADAMSGKVAYYGRKFAGRRTASGQRFNPDALTMAHLTLPFGTMVKVTNMANKRSVVVRVNDRGPTTPGRIGDVSLAAAKRLRMTRAGVVDVQLEVVGKGK